jgi:hypothetical protein
MTIFVDINAALTNHLNTMTGKPSIAWENVEFTPVKGTLYIRPTLLPGDSIPATIGTAGHDINRGVYQIDIFAPPNDSTKAALDMADLISTRFKHGSVLTSNSVTVEIQSVSRRPALNDPNGWYKLMIEIVYYSFTARR